MNAHGSAQLKAARKQSVRYHQQKTRDVATQRDDVASSEGGSDPVSRCEAMDSARSSADESACVRSRICPPLPHSRDYHTRLWRVKADRLIAASPVCGTKSSRAAAGRLHPAGRFITDKCMTPRRTGVLPRRRSLRARSARAAAMGSTALYKAVSVRISPKLQAENSSDDIRRPPTARPKTLLCVICRREGRCMAESCASNFARRPTLSCNVSVVGNTFV